MSELPNLKAFEGRWTLSRTITDRLADRMGAFQGRAVFTPRGGAVGVMDYLETGQMVFDGQSPMAASRAYVWAQTETGIDVRFDDGRDFHTLSADQVRPDAVHHCDPDLYHVSYDFSEWDQAWQAVWRVQGPRKNYKMVSRYHRG